MTWIEYLVLGAAAVAAGAINSIAGGGTLLTFPALTWSLGDSSSALIVANATSTVALCPGSFSSAAAYRRELQQYRRWVKLLLLPSLLGSLFGTWLLLYDKPEHFKLCVPWLILTATILFALQPTLSARLRKVKNLAMGIDETPSPRRIAAIIVLQFVIAFYGGYFGAGIGILMLSSLGLMGLTDIHGMNGVKTILASLINAVAVLLFLGQEAGWLPRGEGVNDTIDWQRGVPMIVAGIIGGYFGARVARRLDRNRVRHIVVLIGGTLAAWYFYRTWFAA